MPSGIVTPRMRRNALKKAIGALIIISGIVAGFYLKGQGYCLNGNRYSGWKFYNINDTITKPNL